MPFLMEKKPRDGEILEGNNRYEGYAVDLMAMLAEKMENFPYIIQVVKDGSYGSIGENGQWNGMVGELLVGQCRLVED